MRTNSADQDNEALKGESALIPLEQINIPDHIRVFSFPGHDDALDNSVKKYGMISPVTIIKKGGAFDVVCGVKRINAAKNADIDSVQAIVMDDSGLSEMGQFDIAFSDNNASRKFNPIEAGGIVSMLMDKFGISQGDIISRYHSVIDFRSGREGIDTLKKIFLLKDNIKYYIVKWNIPVSAVSRLLDFDRTGIKAVFRMVEYLQLHGGKLKQFLELVYEICRRENLKPDALFEENEIKRIVENSGITISQKQTKLTEYLIRMRYPELTKRADDFIKISSDIQNVDAGTFSPPLNFEGSRLFAKFAFNSIEEIDNFCSAMKIESNREKIRSLLDLL
ncbi:ParB/RepB/Spo0J family partition protein [candidate division KSB1 bacterium]